MEFMRQRQTQQVSIQAPPMLGLIETVKDYVDCMLGETQGRKALIMDKETLGNQLIISLHFSNCITGIQQNIDSLEGSIFHRNY